MKNILEKIGRSMNNFMYGRYGADELSVFTLTASLVFNLLSYIPKLGFLYFLASFLAVVTVLRCFSKNISRRRAELNVYMKYKNKIETKIHLYKRIFSERKTHRYFRCKKCKAIMRVPKGRGKIEITCPQCRNTTIKKT